MAMLFPELEARELIPNQMLRTSRSLTEVQARLNQVIRTNRTWQREHDHQYPRP
jgi:hypothetical protein